MSVSRPARWQTDRAGGRAPDAHVSLLLALRRGVTGRCPACGQAALFEGYLRVRNACPVCATPLGRLRADDAPPYFTILLVAHIVVPGMLVLERTAMPPLWVHAAIWLPLTLILTLGLLRPVKGATVGVLLRLDEPAPAEDS